MATLTHQQQVWGSTPKARRQGHSKGSAVGTLQRLGGRGSPKARRQGHSKGSAAGTLQTLGGRGSPKARRQGLQRLGDRGSPKARRQGLQRLGGRGSPKARQQGLFKGSPEPGSGSETTSKARLGGRNVQEKLVSQPRPTRLRRAKVNTSSGVIEDC